MRPAAFLSVLLVNRKFFCYTSLMRTQNQIISDCSRAGKFGASIRWGNHVKVSTSLIRINTYDRDYLSSLAARRGVSVGRVVGIVCDCLRSGKISLPES